MRSTLSAISLAVLIPTIAGHCVWTDVVGDAGRPRGYGLGVNFQYPKNCVTTKCQRDVTVFPQTGPQSTWKSCGKTHMQADRYKAGAQGFEPNAAEREVPNDPAAEIPKIVEQGALPIASAGGYLNITIFQINVDGAGPFRCGISANGDGNDFKIVPDILRQAPGDRLGLFNENSQKNVPLQVRIPADLKCTGEHGSKKTVCILRCQNPATNGPFGACIPFELKEAAPPPPKADDGDEGDDEGEEGDEEKVDNEEKRRRFVRRQLARISARKRIVRRQAAGKPTEEEVEFLKGGEKFTAEEEKVIRNGRRPSMFRHVAERRKHGKPKPPPKAAAVAAPPIENAKAPGKKPARSKGNSNKKPAGRGARKPSPKKGNQKKGN
ncbi:uncharacterized protein DFL_009894 [Arthrobotrys flagrans]|uniref:Chitin-binding type-4 domain-containing protein n=1 Tax=Arthrobotrys flagrans TaxID=97331 RepID=A0A436ZSY4_ARTFL|nr:hypothetical protein DFL_009894 [Arthrobotrys flagrans]